MNNYQNLDFQVTEFAPMDPAYEHVLLDCTGCSDEF